MKTSGQSTHFYAGDERFELQAETFLGLPRWVVYAVGNSTEACLKAWQHTTGEIEPPAYFRIVKITCESV